MNEQCVMPSVHHHRNKRSSKYSNQHQCFSASSTIFSKPVFDNEKCFGTIGCMYWIQNKGRGHFYAWHESEAASINVLQWITSIHLVTHVKMQIE